LPVLVARGDLERGRFTGIADADFDGLAAARRRQSPVGACNTFRIP